MTAIIEPSSEKPVHPFAIADYRLFWMAQFAAVIATMAIVVIIGWQVYDIARTDYGMSPKQAALQLGLIGIAQFLPLFFLAPIAGWVADRFARQTVARAANSVDIIVAIGLGWLTYSDTLTLPALFIMAAAHGVARSFVGPSMSALAPNLVPLQSLPQAIAFNSIARQAGSVIGPALGGFLYAAGPSKPYWLAATLLMIATVFLGFIKPVRTISIKGHAHPVTQIIDGLRYVKGHRFLLGAITLDLFAVLLAGATALLPVFARDILHVGPEGLGQMRAAPAIGAGIIAILFALRPLKTEVGLKMLLAVAFFGAVTVAFGFSGEVNNATSSLPPWIFPNVKVFHFEFGPIYLSRGMAYALTMLALLGAADMFSVYIRSSLVQLHTPDTMRGRVSAVGHIAISASNELGETQSGFAAALLGPVGAVIFGGIGAIVVTLIWAYIFPELRQAKSFDPPKELM